MSELGKKGGSVSSERKTEASRITIAKARAVRKQNNEVKKQQKKGKVMKSIMFSVILLALSGCAWAQSDPNQGSQNTNTGYPLGAAPHCTGWNC